MTSTTENTRQQDAIDEPKKPVPWTMRVGQLIFLVITLFMLVQIHVNAVGIPRTWTIPTQEGLQRLNGIFHVSRFARNPGYEIKAPDGKVIYFSCSPDYGDTYCLANTAEVIDGMPVSIGLFNHLNKRPALRLRHSTIVMFLSQGGKEILNYKARKKDLESVEKYEDSHQSYSWFAISMEMLIGLLFTVVVWRTFKPLKR